MDKAESENQVIYGYKQERRNGTDFDNFDNPVYLSIDIVFEMIAYLKFQSASKRSMQQILRILQTNLFEKWYLDNLVRGRSTDKLPINPNQLSYAVKLTGYQ